MDACYYLLLSLGETLELHNFDTYTQLWQYLQDRLFMDRPRWYQIYWGDSLILQTLLV